MTVGRAAALTLAAPFVALVLLDLLAVSFIVSFAIGLHHLVDFIFDAMRERTPLNRRDVW